MFDKINGPTNQYEGPATGLTTEKGDSWHTAVKKINDGFANIVRFLEGGAPAIESAAESGWEKVAHDLAEAMSLLQIKHDALEARVKTLSGGPAASLAPATDASKPDPKPIAPAKPDPKAEPQTASFGTGTASPLATLAAAEDKIPDPKPVGASDGAGTRDADFHPVGEEQSKVAGAPEAVTKPEDADPVKAASADTPPSAETLKRAAETQLNTTESSATSNG